MRTTTRIGIHAGIWAGLTIVGVVALIAAALFFLPKMQEWSVQPRRLSDHEINTRIDERTRADEEFSAKVRAVLDLPETTEIAWQNRGAMWQGRMVGADGNTYAVTAFDRDAEPPEVELSVIAYK